MISEGAKTVTKVERSYPRQMQCKVLYIVLRFVLVSSFSSFGERFVITFEAHAARCRMANAILNTENRPHKTTRAAAGVV